MDLFDTEAIQNVEADGLARTMLEWMHDVRRVLIGRSAPNPRPPLAFTGFSALRLSTGDAQHLSRMTEVLTRTHTIADRITPNPPPRVVDSSAPGVALRRLPNMAPGSAHIGATDLDAAQRDGGAPWYVAPQAVSGPTAAANQVRTHALRAAATVTLLPRDFVTVGDSFTVAFVTPGWVALESMVRLAEIEHHVGLGIVPVSQIDAVAAASVDRVLSALDVSARLVTTTMEAVTGRVGRRDRGLRWDGEDGVGAAVDRFFSLVERRPSILHDIDDGRRRMGLAPRGINQGLDYLEYMAAGLGMRFAPRLSFDDR